jgi:hypothetical protein
MPEFLRLLRDSVVYVFELFASFKVTLLNVFWGLLVNYDFERPLSFLNKFLLAVFTVPDFDLIDFFHAEVADILRTLRMDPASVYTLLLTHFASNHKVGLYTAFAHAI